MTISWLNNSSESTQVLRRASIIKPESVANCRGERGRLVGSTEATGRRHTANDSLSTHTKLLIFLVARSVRSDFRKSGEGPSLPQYEFAWQGSLAAAAIPISESLGAIQQHAVNGVHSMLMSRKDTKLHKNTIWASRLAIFEHWAFELEATGMYNLSKRILGPGRKRI